MYFAHNDFLATRKEQISAFFRSLAGQKRCGLVKFGLIQEQIALIGIWD